MSRKQRFLNARFTSKASQSFRYILEQIPFDHSDKWRMTLHPGAPHAEFVIGIDFTPFLKRRDLLLEHLAVVSHLEAHRTTGLIVRNNFQAALPS